MRGLTRLKNVTRFQRFALVAVVALGLSGLASCAPPEDQEAYTATCNLPVDQKNTLTGRWKFAPIMISFSLGAFNSYEMGLMMDAADTWNRFYQATHGFDIIDYGSRAVPRQNDRPRPYGNICQTTLLNSSGSFAGSVVIYKDTTWPANFAAAAIAITSTCASTTTATVAPFYSAMMEINYQNFFVAGKQLPDLTSIVVHELGHLLGLDHSCAQTGAGAKPPLCSGSSLDASYYDAVMYPTVSFKADGNGTVRRSLNSNDQGRANCLYGENAL